MKQFALLIVATCACASGPAVDPRAFSFTRELVACVDKADTREDSHRCRAEVERKYADGGVFAGSK